MLDGLLMYYAVLNIIAFIMMGMDKQRAKKNKWRIPEKRLWLIAFIGGAIGATLAMNQFKHKTMHRNFQVFLPILSILHMVLLLYLIVRELKLS
ncbi:DUF1294 domain-containing protein [Gracilibacillus sp. YIM 98692]|uniref:DUF1294 domain-containing protein n=1 Tax=Gracilibacillus sp. YIM 98692 TaxID=2663532 RepID=UPI0013D81726|nr:DUF1294 domain-containing protein [Gracilibacillus sp. YIM 98692]